MLIDEAFYFLDFLDIYWKRFTLKVEDKPWFDIDII